MHRLSLAYIIYMHHSVSLPRLLSNDSILSNNTSYEDGGELSGTTSDAKRDRSLSSMFSVETTVVDIEDKTLIPVIIGKPGYSSAFVPEPSALLDNTYRIYRADSAASNSAEEDICNAGIAANKKWASDCNNDPMNAVQDETLIRNGSAGSDSERDSDDGDAEGGPATTTNATIDKPQVYTYNKLSVTDIIGNHDWNKFKEEYGKESWNVTDCVKKRRHVKSDDHPHSLPLSPMKSKRKTIPTKYPHEYKDLSPSIVRDNSIAKLLSPSSALPCRGTVSKKCLTPTQFKPRRSPSHLLRSLPNSPISKVTYNSKHIHNMPLHIEKNWMYNYNQGKRKFKSNIYWGQMKLTEAMQLTAEEYQPNRTLTCVVVKLLHDIQDKLLAASRISDGVLRYVLRCVYVDYEYSFKKGGDMRYMLEKKKLIDDYTALYRNMSQKTYFEDCRLYNELLMVGATILRTGFNI